MPVRSVMVSVALAVLTCSGCGDDEQSAADRTTFAAPSRAATVPGEREQPARRPVRARRGRTITLRDSPFGTMLFDSRRQAIYVFENDRRNRTVCYSECARAWPPVTTRGTPRAAKGVRQSLLGTIKRRDGRRQVTYDGRPLYFYAHERPGEVRCHNVDLNGGLWWVVGPDGRRRA
jgi:predicted lipoprotein with Yx(FWY)xxD motif